MKKPKKKVLSRGSLPTPSPISIFVLGWIALDHWEAPLWLYGVGGTFIGIWLIAFVASLWTEEAVIIEEIQKS
ncbi:MAG TPA: hypothetical protein PLZ24_14490 [Flavobacteriales bacterium]|nr:hypothetical protein [Flavobacteriales bacterium]